MNGQRLGNFRMGGSRLLLVLCLIFLFAFPADAFARVVCGPFWGSGRGVGPADYNDPNSAGLLNNVESNHFTPRVRTLQGGQTSYIGSDIRYTLNVFPNHPHALDAMSRLVHRDGEDPPRGSHLTAECWFLRALEYRPNDVNVHLAYALHHNRNGKKGAAIERLQEALRIDPTSAAVHYNLGLLLADQRRFQQAREHAERAYQLGATQPGLRNRLQVAGFPVRAERSEDVGDRLRLAGQHYERGDLQAAVEVLHEASELAPADPEIHYNLGVMLVRMGEHERAREHAQRAYDLGFPRDGLKNSLERAGYPIVEN